MMLSSLEKANLTSGLVFVLNIKSTWKLMMINPANLIGVEQELLRPKLKKPYKVINEMGNWSKYIIYELKLVIPQESLLG